ncbi:hypothetical protein [Pseudarthrobacter sp. NPDC058119]|uniref:hypothetical protein n=1 Tax=Pseudarthrobacter sp. NPDC058119 TaxID=3346348 RepID=UPI0036DDA5A1
MTQRSGGLLKTLLTLLTVKPSKHALLSQTVKHAKQAMIAKTVKTRLPVKTDSNDSKAIKTCFTVCDSKARKAGNDCKNSKDTIARKDSNDSKDIKVGVWRKIRQWSELAWTGSALS